MVHVLRFCATVAKPPRFSQIKRLVEVAVELVLPAIDPDPERPVPPPLPGQAIQRHLFLVSFDPRRRRPCDALLILILIYPRAPSRSQGPGQSNTSTPPDPDPAPIAASPPKWRIHVDCMQD